MSEMKCLFVNVETCVAVTSYYQATIMSTFESVVMFSCLASQDFIKSVIIIILLNEWLKCLRQFIFLISAANNVMIIIISCFIFR